ncbi:arsenate reductase/protein-tyrosine-phosphatase family protein, partial [Enterobacter hormaechei]
RARQLTEADFRKFGHIYVMDQTNLRDLQAVAPWRPLARVSLLMDVVPGRAGTAVIDPYYGGADEFAEVWEDVSIAAKQIVARLGR